MTQPPTNCVVAAQREMKRTGIPASFQLAQWALESAWGKKDLGCFNYFGMKCPVDLLGRPKLPYVMMRTKEQRRDGGVYYINAPFRKFASADEAFAAHADLLCKPIYAKAKAKLPDLDAYIDAVAPIYATGLAYAKSIKAIIHGSNLTAYDHVAMPAQPVAAPVMAIVPSVTEKTVAPSPPLVIRGLNDMPNLSGYKTYITAILAILAAVGAVLQNQMTWQQALPVVVSALLGAFVRHGVATTAAGTTPPAA